MLHSSDSRLIVKQVSLIFQTNFTFIIQSGFFPNFIPTIYVAGFSFANQLPILNMQLTK